MLFSNKVFDNKFIMMLKILLILIMSIPLLNVVNSDADAEQLYSLGSSTTGGTYYIIGSGLAMMLYNELEGIQIRSVTTGGSIDNIQMLATDEIQFAVIASVSAATGYTGEGTFEGKPQENLRVICSLHPSLFQFVVRKDSGIKTFEDFRGSRGWPGGLGSGGDQYTEQFLSILDINYKERKDFVPTYTNESDTVSLMKDGHLDWAHLSGGLPTSSIMEVNSSVDIDIFPIKGEIRDRFLEKYPYYIPFTIPAGTYIGFNEDIETVAAVAYFVVNKGVSERLVYDIAKAIGENIDRIRGIHGSLANFSLEDAVKGIKVPLHPGALKYYKEIGLIK